MLSSGQSYAILCCETYLWSEDNWLDIYWTEVIQSLTVAMLRKTPGLASQSTDQVSTPTTVQRPDSARQTRGAPPSATQTSWQCRGCSTAVYCGTAETLQGLGRTNKTPLA